MEDVAIERRWKLAKQLLLEICAKNVTEIRNVCSVYVLLEL